MRPLGTDAAAADLGSNLSHELRFLADAIELPEGEATIASGSGRPADVDAAARVARGHASYGRLDPGVRVSASAAAAAAAAEEASRVAERAAAQLASPCALALGLLEAYASEPLARQVH